MSILFSFFLVCISFVLGYTLGTNSTRLRLSKDNQYFILENWLCNPVRYCFTVYEVRKASLRASKKENLYK